MNRTNKEIVADKKFTKCLQDHVTNSSRRVLCFSLYDDEVIAQGSKCCVDIMRAADLDMTVRELMEKMRQLGPSNNEELSYSQIGPSIKLPRMDVKFKGPNWNLKTAHIFRGYHYF